MNKISATVTEIEACESLHVVKFKHKDISLQMMSLELNASVQVGSNVILQVKPSHVSIGKNLVGEISLGNQMPAKICDIENGKLLTRVLLDITNETQLESIITTQSATRMHLKQDDEVLVLIKSSELSLYEVIDA